MKVGTCLVSLFMSLACTVSPLTPTENLEPWIGEEWKICQGWLIEEPWLLDPNKVGVIQPESFRWKPVNAPFTCGDVENAVGCFTSNKLLITYVVTIPEVVRHEACHAILYRLGDERWHCFQHRASCVEE